MSDIHGQYDAFIKMLETINFSEKDTLYILGDIIDRGEKSVELFDYIKSHKNIKMILGNHEKMMLDYFHNYTSKLQRPRLLQLWVDNGGNKTIDSILKSKNSDEKIKEMVDYFNALPLYIDVKIGKKKFLLCHAGMVYRKNFSLEENIEMNLKNDEILWRRTPSYNTGAYVIVHGHTQSAYFFGDNTIVAYCGEKAIDIDCGAASKSRLGCLCLDNYQTYFVEIGVDCDAN